MCLGGLCPGSHLHLLLDDRARSALLLEGLVRCKCREGSCTRWNGGRCNNLGRKLGALWENHVVEALTRLAALASGEDVLAEDASVVASTAVGPRCTAVGVEHRLVEPVGADPDSASARGHLHLHADLVVLQGEGVGLVAQCESHSRSHGLCLCCLCHHLGGSRRNNNHLATGTRRRLSRRRRQHQVSTLGAVRRALASRVEVLAEGATVLVPARCRRGAEVRVENALLKVA